MIMRWEIIKLECYPNYSDASDVVITVHYKIIGEQDGYVVEHPAAQSFSTAPNEPFTPFNQLTQDIVIDWVKDSLGSEGIQELEYFVQTQLDRQINPPVVFPPVPW